MKHLNDGACQHCLEIINRFPNFDAELLTWFLMVQAAFPDFHIAEAGRGRQLQDEDFAHGLSKASYGESAHNYNLAFDTFFLVDEKYSLDPKLYAALVPEIPDHIEWYGAQGAVFYERPHFEKRNWKYLRAQGLLKLVE